MAALKYGGQYSPPFNYKVHYAYVGALSDWYLCSGEFQYKAAPEGQSHSTSLLDESATLGMIWTCAYSFTYRETCCRSVHLSHDSSMLCVAHGPVVSIWDPSTLQLHATLQTTTPQHAVKYIHTLVLSDPHPLDK